MNQQEQQPGPEFAANIRVNHYGRALFYGFHAYTNGEWHQYEVLSTSKGLTCWIDGGGEDVPSWWKPFRRNLIRFCREMAREWKRFVCDGL
jgi:hypothetical protein